MSPRDRSRSPRMPPYHHQHHPDGQGEENYVRLSTDQHQQTTNTNTTNTIIPFIDHPANGGWGLSTSPNETASVTTPTRNGSNGNITSSDRTHGSTSVSGTDSPSSESRSSSNTSGSRNSSIGSRGSGTSTTQSITSRSNSIANGGASMRASNNRLSSGLPRRHPCRPVNRPNNNSNPLSPPSSPHRCHHHQHLPHSHLVPSPPPITLRRKRRMISSNRRSERYYGTGGGYYGSKSVFIRIKSPAFMMKTIITIALATVIGMFGMSLVYVLQHIDDEDVVGSGSGVKSVAELLHRNAPPGSERALINQQQQQRSFVLMEGIASVASATFSELADRSSQLLPWSWRSHRAPQIPKDFSKQFKSAPQCAALHPDDVTFTLVLQLSSDRFWMMEHHCERWGYDSPISVAVYADKSPGELRYELKEMGCNPAVITVQTLHNTTFPQGEYPVNILRNMALSAIRTSHAMYVDADFWPSTNLHSVLSSPSIRQQFATDSRLSVVIPALRIRRQCGEFVDCRPESVSAMPETFGEIRKMVSRREAGAFDPTNPGGHSTTNYGVWSKQVEGELHDLPCVKSNRYEPYLAFRFCDVLPPLQEQFTGYGKNKMTWVMQMRHTGYKFSQLGGVFLVHYPHLESKSRKEWNERPEDMFKTIEDEATGKTKKKMKMPKDMKDVDWSQFKRGKVDQLYVEFREWLRTAVKDAARVDMCEGAEDDDKKLWINKNNNVGNGGEKQEEDEEEEEKEGDDAAASASLSSSQD